MTQVATPEYGQGMSPNVPKTPPRQIRIGDEWYDFDAAAKAQGTERAALVREFIAWYLRRPGAKLPTRPEVEAWQRQEQSYITTDGSDRYHASEDCPAFQRGRTGNEAQGIPLRPVVHLSAEEAEAAPQTKCTDCLGDS